MGVELCLGVRPNPAVSKADESICTETQTDLEPAQSAALLTKGVDRLPCLLRIGFLSELSLQHRTRVTGKGQLWHYVWSHLPA